MSNISLREEMNDLLRARQQRQIPLNDDAVETVVYKSQQAAEQLFNADTQRHLIPQLSQSYEGIELEDAYAIQDLWLKMRVDRGARLIGRKIGLTSRAMQMASNFNEPDYGYLTDDMLLADGAQIDLSRYISPRLEVELGFVMGQDLQGAGCTVADVMRATRR